MRQRILTLGLVLVARTLVAQEAVYRASTGAGQNPALAITAPVSGNAWIDLRQNAKSGAVQSAPDWVEAVTFIPAGTQADAPVPSVFRIRLARPGGRASVLFFASSLTIRLQRVPRLWFGTNPARNYSGPVLSAPALI